MTDLPYLVSKLAEFLFYHIPDAVTYVVRSDATCPPKCDTASR